ncbi:hypothetical protein [Streptomyces sp. NPDC015131]|uniref:hypothetical protein n=1 Tax=Streptomyces sp. NPDC015131 TaxID=3364941 RepID=UPI0036FCA51C
MSDNAKKGLLHTGPSQEDSAASGSSAATVAHDGPHIDPGDIVQLWADARCLYYAGFFPKYASDDWIALDPDDPKRLAAALDAAEKWRKYGDEEALIQWFRDCTRARPTGAESAESARRAAAYIPPPARPVQASPGWPPIRVPGTDKWRHLIDGRQVDMPHNRTRTYREGRAAA